MKPRKPLTERVLALLLALVTATTLVPAPALAEAVDELAATPQAEAAAEEQPAEDTPTLLSSSLRPSRPLRLPLQERPMPPQSPLPTR